jgi:hypothetical protein
VRRQSGGFPGGGGQVSGVNIRVVSNPAAYRDLLNSPSGAVARDIYRRGQRVATAAKRLCPVDHGRLRSSIQAVLVEHDGVPVCEVGTDVHYAMFVHGGTGIYGPRGARIDVGHVMVFTPRKAGGQFIKRSDRGVVFARSTAGMKGTPFLTDALPAARG